MCVCVRIFTKHIIHTHTYVLRILSTTHVPLSCTTKLTHTHRYYIHASLTHSLTLINSVSHLSHPQLGSPFREPVMKFALKFPHQTVEFFLSHLAEPPISSVFHFFLGHKEGGPLRETLASCPEKIVSYTFTVKVTCRSVLDCCCCCCCCCVCKAL